MPTNDVENWEAGRIVDFLFAGPTIPRARLPRHLSDLAANR